MFEGNQQFSNLNLHQLIVKAKAKEKLFQIFPTELNDWLSITELVFTGNSK